MLSNEKVKEPGNAHSLRTPSRSSCQPYMLEEYDSVNLSLEHNGTAELLIANELTMHRNANGQHKLTLLVKVILTHNLTLYNCCIIEGYISLADRIYPISLFDKTERQRRTRRDN